MIRRGKVKQYAVYDLTDVQQRAVSRLKRAIKAAQVAGLGLVADGQCGLRVMRAEDLNEDDLREIGFTLDLDSSCNMGGTVNMEIGGAGG